MSSRLELSPAQLDRLEDALEDLERGPPPAVEPGDPVASRLSEFRDLLQLSREAMPMQDVPAGLLDGVLAEARQAATRAPARPERRSLWSRWRLGVWLPALGFAGSAAILLVILLPKGDAPEATVARVPEAPVQGAPASKLDGRLADARGFDRAKDQDDQELRAQGLAIGERGSAAAPPPPAPAAEPEPEPLAEADAAVDAPADAPAEEDRSPARAVGKKAEPTPLPAPAPAKSGGAKARKSKGGKPKPNKKDDAGDLPGAPAGIDLWPEVIEGDALRRQGNCGLATMRYRKARKAEDARVRARALAGEGLCEYAKGNFGKVKKLFAQARAADSGVGTFIDAERSRLDQAPAVEAGEDQVQTKE